MSNPATNPREHIGANNPPSALELAEPTIEVLRQFLKDYPVIANEDESRGCKAILDRTVSVLKAIEEERKSKVDPLNAQVKAINETYHQWYNADSKRPGRWNRLLETLRNRLSDWAWKEEARRIAEAEAARKAAEAAELAARAAEQREREAVDTAAAGVCDVDIAAASQDADEAFSRFRKADRVAARAERDTKVRIGGGSGKVTTLRTRETLTVTNWKAAIEDICGDENEPPATIVDAIVTCARAYRKVTGRLPSGINSQTERVI